MSQLSCINALKLILADQAPEIITVADIEESPPTFTPDESPYCILVEGKVDEVRLSGGYGGGKQVDFPIELHLFTHSGVLDATSAQEFRTLVDKLQSVLRSAHRLNNLADTTNSQVLFSGERLSTTVFPWTMDAGLYLHHAVITLWVEEIATDSVL